jgi:hypothetical protein
MSISQHYTHGVCEGYLPAALRCVTQLEFRPTNTKTKFSQGGRTIRPQQLPNGKEDEHIVYRLQLERRRRGEWRGRDHVTDPTTQRI